MKRTISTNGRRPARSHELLRCGRASRAEQAPCKPYEFENHAYTLCKATLSRFSIRLFWQRPDGAPYSYLSALPKTDGNGGRLAFALNGGMFDPDYRPVGLYIEEGRELVRANTKAGPGNFHLKPNGVFYAGDGEAGVMETGAFLKKNRKRCSRRNRVRCSSSRANCTPASQRPMFRQRRAMGSAYQGEGVVLFAISEGEVPFDTFERLFRDGLKCSNALFLDGGSAPALYVPSASRGGNNLLGLGP